MPMFEMTPEMVAEYERMSAEVMALIAKAAQQADVFGISVERQLAWDLYHANIGKSRYEVRIRELEGSIREMSESHRKEIVDLRKMIADLKFQVDVLDAMQE